MRQDWPSSGQSVVMTTDQVQNVVHLTLTQAADACGVSRSTIKRRREAGSFPGATQRDGSWVIPIPDLLAAGLNPGRPSPPEDMTQAADQGRKSVDDSDEPVVTLPISEFIDLREELAAAKADAQTAQAIASERQRALDDLRQMLTRALPPAEAPSNAPAARDGLQAPSTVAQPIELPRRRWWGGRSRV